MRTQCLTVCQIGKRGGGGELRGCKVRFVHSLGDVPCFCERAGAVFFWETFRTGGPMQIGRTEQVRFSTVSNNKKSPASDFSHPPPKFVRACILNNIQYPLHRKVDREGIFLETKKILVREWTLGYSRETDLSYPPYLPAKKLIRCNRSKK